MKTMGRSDVAFLLISVALAIALLLQLYPLHLLYLDASVRRAMPIALQKIAVEKGILLSGFTIQSLSSDRAVVFHRTHMRGHDPEACFEIDLTDTTYHPCGE